MNARRAIASLGYAHAGLGRYDLAMVWAIH